MLVECFYIWDGVDCCCTATPHPSPLVTPSALGVPEKSEHREDLWGMGAGEGYCWSVIYSVFRRKTFSFSEGNI